MVMKDETEEGQPQGSGNPELDRILQISDWASWHESYEDPNSELVKRQNAVRAQVAHVIEACPAGPVTVVSICAGQGREVIGALATHRRRADVRGRLVELN